MCQCRYCTKRNRAGYTNKIPKGCAEIIADCMLAKCIALGLIADQEFTKACRRRGVNPEVAISAPLDFLTVGGRMAFYVLPQQS